MSPGANTRGYETLGMLVRYDAAAASAATARATSARKQVDGTRAAPDRPVGTRAVEAENP